MAWQFHRPDLHGGVVQVFRRPRSIYESARLKLQGLIPDKKYVLRNVDEAQPTEVMGAKLMEKGFLAFVPEAPFAVTIVYSEAEKEIR